jgi:glycosyltransferase involved in cell wall biosynthesis
LRPPDAWFGTFALIRLLIATDAWRPQVNGVVRSIERMIEELPRLGATVELLTPGMFRTVPMPTYPEVRLAMVRPSTIGARIEALKPDAIHIATEGPIGFAARRWCLRNRRRFTTAYHSRFPEYIRERVPVPLRLSYAMLRRFHNAGNGCMVATRSLRHELEQRGFTNLLPWGRGVDAGLFRPRADARLSLPKPIFLYVGRVAVEKNLDAFLGLDLPGSKVVVGDGPDLGQLKARYPAAHFLGVRIGEQLAETYAAADVFVFPSRTDTFGMVLLEALASGAPVAAYPVAGPRDVIGDVPVGVLGEDLRAAALAALRISREACRGFALRYTWEASARQFIDNVILGQGDEMPRLVLEPQT